MPIRHSTPNVIERLTFADANTPAHLLKILPLKFEQGVTVEASNELEMSRYYENYPHAHLCDRSL